MTVCAVPRMDPLERWKDFSEHRLRTLLYSPEKQ
jgi:hypothetical protein